MKIRWRFVFIAMHVLGITVTYMHRINIGVALLSMINSEVFDNKIINVTINECNKDFVQNLTTIPKSRRKNRINQTKTFYWTESQQSMVLSSFYWGYGLLQIPTGILILYMDSKILYIISMFISSTFTTLLPWAASLGIGYFIGFRFIIGLAQSLYFPSLYGLASKWVLDNDKSIFFATVSASCAFGTISGQSMAGILADTLGWQWIFYTQGILGFLICGTYWMLITESPMTHPWISEEETKLFQKIAHLHNEKTKPKIPWIKLMLSMPCWALIVVSITFNFQWYIIFHSLPYYVGLVLGFPIGENGIISSGPFIFNGIFSIVGGLTLNYLKKNSFVSKTNIFKVHVILTNIPAALMLFCINFTECSTIIPILLISLVMGLMGTLYTLYSSCPAELSPSFAGFIFSVLNTLGNVMGFVTPYVKNFFTETGETRDNWTNIFWVSSMSMIISTVFFSIFGSAGLQSWDLSAHTLEIEDVDSDLYRDKEESV